MWRPWAPARPSSPWHRWPSPDHGRGETFHTACEEPGTYLPARHTEGPWSRHFQHGGPPTALLTRAIEGMLAGEDLRIGRVTYEIPAPVPMLPLRVTTAVSRPGRLVRRVEATLTAGERPVITASAWAILPAPAGLPVDTASADALPAPDSVPPADPAAHPEWNCGFLAAIERRFIHGDYRRPGPAAVWVRPRVPLLAGETLSPVRRIALTADSANGVSAVLDIRDWTFIPPELTLHVLRPPDGQWLCLDARSMVAPGSVGLATATLHDRQGPVARSAQSLYVSSRDASG